MGPSLAVSRYHQQLHLYMQDNAPNLWDHDFPKPGYLLTTSGYQMQSTRTEHDCQLEKEDELNRVDLNDYSEDPDSVNVVREGAVPEECSVQPTDKDKYRDKLGRLHFMKTTYGPAVLVQRATKFTQSVAFIKVDNGSDWNVRSLVNSLYLCCLWKDSGLDILGVVSYAAKYSGIQ